MNKCAAMRFLHSLQFSLVLTWHHAHATQAMLQLLHHVAHMPSGPPPPGPLFLSRLSLVEGLAGPPGVGGLCAIMGAPELQVVLSLWSLLPWLCVRHAAAGPLFRAATSVMQRASAQVGFAAVSHALGTFAASDPAQLYTSIASLCTALVEDTFPRYARLALQRLLEQMQQGAVEYKAPVLLILHCVLQVPGGGLGDALGGGASGQPFLLAPVARLMEADERNPLGAQVG